MHLILKPFFLFPTIKNALDMLLQLATPFVMMITIIRNVTMMVEIAVDYAKVLSIALFVNVF